MKPPSPAPLWSKAKVRTQVRTRPRNQARNQARVETCQRIIGYRFKNINLIEEALTPKASFNQRLALAGDRAADLQLVARWYGNKGSLTPWQWDKIKGALLGNTNLAQVGKRLRIQDCLPTRCTDDKMATTVEAIIGAVWMDSEQDLAAVGSVMDRFGLTRHPLLPSHLPSPTTTDQPPCEIRSSRLLPDRFFTGHHLGLLQLLFSYGQSSVVHQRAGQHTNLLHHEQRREAATERLPTDMRTRPKHILLAPQTIIEKAQKWVAARIGRKNEHLGQEPSAREPSELPVQHAPAPVPATKGQTKAGNRVSALESTLPVQHPVTQSGCRSNVAGQHDEPTGLHIKDTEWTRITWFIWSISRTILFEPSNRRKRGLRRLIYGLQTHRRVLAKLPDSSLKNIPDDRWPDGVYLTTHSSDRAYDKALVLHIQSMTQHYYRIKRMRKRRTLQPEEESIRTRVAKRLRELWMERLKLWLPKDAQENHIPTFSADLGPASELSSETTLSGSTVPAAVDSTGEPTISSAEDKRPHKPGRVLWTIDAGQNTSVDWKQYLRKPPSQTE